MSKRAFAFGALVIMLLVAAAFTGRSIRESAEARRPSSYAPAAEGLLGFRRLLEDLGFATSVSRQPWDTYFAASSSPSLLIVATPFVRPPAPAEIEALEAALERGAHLLVLDDATVLEASPAFDEMLEEIGLGGERVLADYDTELLAMRRPPTRRGIGTSARPSDASFERLVLDDATLVASTEAVPLAVNDDGEVLAALAEVGRGRVVRVMGVPAANDRLLEGDNLEFALGLVLGLRQEGPIVFDEFRHGYGSAMPVRGASAGVWLLFGVQALAATLLFATARGVRFGPPRAEVRHARRSSNEFVRSMASLYRRARAHRHAVEQAQQRFVREARGRWSLPENVPLDRLATTVSLHTGLAFETVRDTLWRTEVATATPDLGEREMTARVRELARLEEESFGGRETSA